MVSQYISNAVDMKSDKKLSDFEAKFHPFSPMYNPERDIQVVEPELAIDIKEVYNTGIVPPGSPAFVDRYNNCDDPNAIVGRPRNDFETDRMIGSVNASIKEEAAAKQSEV